MKPKRRGKGRTAPVKKPAVKADNVAGASAGGFEILELRQLIRLVQRTGIGELEVTSGSRSVRISAMPSASGSWVSAPAIERPAAEPANAAPAAPGNAAAAAAPPSNLKAITSPMVGTFYRAPAPDADPFVEPGDVVEAGQTVCVIEAMKLMNEIEAEFRGKVVQVLVENAQPVEFGQKLFLVDQT
jgi:acetyl-CoA carboxylase biotin carboxyl carrier protein